MKKTASLFLSAILLAAYPAAAGTLVTWQGTGEVTQSWPNRFGFPQAFPPVGTPLSVTLSFDPSAQFATNPGVPSAAGCMTVGFTGSLTLGGTTYTSRASNAFTHAQLPGANCVLGPGFGGPDSELTQFGFEGLQTPAGAEWNLGSGRLLILTYRDALVRDAFPEAPTAPFGADVWLIDLFQDQRWGFNGVVDLQAVDQTAAVPEPGTMTLLGLGLAAAAYRKRRATRAS